MMMMMAVMLRVDSKTAMTANTVVVVMSLSFSFADVIDCSLQRSPKKFCWHLRKDKNFNVNTLYILYTALKICLPYKS